MPLPAIRKWFINKFRTTISLERDKIQVKIEPEQGAHLLSLLNDHESDKTLKREIKGTPILDPRVPTGF